MDDPLYLTAARERDQDCVHEPTVAAILEAADVAVAWLFGSRARGDAGPGADVDIAVLTPPSRNPLTLLEVSALTGRLENALDAPVDVVDFADASLELRARIVLEGRVVHSVDEALRVRVTVDTQSRWEDLRPALAAMDQAYLDAVADR